MPETYDALVIPGGRAPEYTAAQSESSRRRTPFHFSEKTDCGDLPCGTNTGGRGSCSAGTQGQLLSRRFTGRDAGRWNAFVNIPMDQAVTDGNLVTAPAWPAHPAWLAKFLAVLGTKIEL